MSWKCVLALGTGLLTAAGAAAQSESYLKDYFEGKRVVVKLEMPATKNGVDVFPDKHPPVNLQDYAGRIKDYGVSIRPGESVLITRIKVKKDLIEFHLGGGGFGTWGDDREEIPAPPPTPKSRHEEDLERDLKKVKDPERKRRIQAELDDLEEEREREDARLRVALAQAQEVRRQALREQAREAGSRFNLRYPQGFLLETMTPETIMAGLGDYLEFSFLDTAAAQADTANTPPWGLRKGLTREEVESHLGPASSAEERNEGSLKVVACAYTTDDTIVRAEFVEGVLVRFSTNSK